MWLGKGKVVYSNVTVNNPMGLRFATLHPWRVLKLTIHVGKGTVAAPTTTTVIKASATITNTTELSNICPCLSYGAFENCLGCLGYWCCLMFVVWVGCWW